MTTDEVMQELKARGFSLELNENGEPRLLGNKDMLTLALKKVLHWHRDEIVRRLKLLPPPYRPRQWLWPSGHVWTEQPFEFLWQKEGEHAVGAWWVRHGKGPWQAVPGSPGADNMHRVDECFNRPPIRSPHEYQPQGAAR